MSSCVLFAEETVHHRLCLAFQAPCMFPDSSTVLA